ncbi:hypothetical protein BO71DRAFT_390137 [Aspergillus ellipticus CBS 707.79]|uniref:Uncharacterized protein n=1 Tax=Aspergillus ellipticus CBS 707.79 TaxID=1448320 RepID=A0A319CVA2_9EURO|nr:hypothetical protein BO71DRAFT_390137 [Aspergillus ellipticus CBS 707.79]
MLQKYNFQEAAHCGWGYGSPNKWADSAATIFDELHNWAVKYAHWDAKVLTEKQRKDLLASIDEYCIQDDLEVILSGLPGQLHTAFVPDLVGMFLIKDCLARFFHNPLWYLVPRLPSDEGDSARAMPPTASGFGADAFTLYQNLLTTHPIYANCWRLWTARLSTPNISPKEVNVNNSFGQAMAAHREHIVDKMCTDLLKHDILQPVIRPLESQKEIDIRIRQLQRVYKMAAKFAVGAACEVTRLEFWTLKQMDPYFHHSSEQARAALNHQLDKEGAKYRLDGQRILALRAPLIFLRGTIFDANSEKLVRKAEVIIEDHEG